MVTFMDVIERALTGQPCSERDYDLKIFSIKLREILKEYDIKYDPENPIPSDDSLADDVFEAALEFYSQVGTYCTDTERIIKFDENEIKERLKTAPSQIVFGEGVDAGTLIPRKPEDKTRPWLFVGAGGAPVSSEDIFVKLVENYARMIPSANAITTPALTTIDGIRIRPRSPLEVLGAIRTVVLAREALRRAGRPGLPIMNCIGTAQSAVALLGGLHPEFGLRKSDGYMISCLAELKTNFDFLNRAAALLSIGVPIGAIFGPIMGGYCGGPEGTAVTTVAYHLMGTMVYRAGWFLAFPIHIKYIASSTPELLWVESVYAQAISRNTHLLSLYYNYTAAGPCTEMCLYEFAAEMITAIVSGVSIETGEVAGGRHEDLLTPIEPMFAAEVALASTGMKRQDANEIVKKLLSKYKDKIANPPLGMKYQECCDIKTGRPSAKCLSIYNKVKKELIDLGLDFKY
ncbi:MAG: monomethylamine:corrinoid methyltransferase [Candidatus Bathyarchaeia archaeon]